MIMRHFISDMLFISYITEALLLQDYSYAKIFEIDFFLLTQNENEMQSTNSN